MFLTMFAGVLSVHKSFNRFVAIANGIFKILLVSVINVIIRNNASGEGIRTIKVLYRNKYIWII